MPMLKRVNDIAYSYDLHNGVWNIICMSKCYIDGLVQDCSISSALAMEILQFCAKPLISCFVKKRPNI